MPKENKTARSKRLVVLMRPDERLAIRVAAAKRDVSMSDYLRDAGLRLVKLDEDPEYTPAA